MSHGVAVLAVGCALREDVRHRAQDARERGLLHGDEDRA